MEDPEAIRRCRGGDRDAFAVLVERYQATVLALCLRMTGSRSDALDVSQQAFVKAYQHLDRYDPHLPFCPWLLKIATNESIAHLRRQRHQPVPVEPETLEYAVGSADDTGDRMALMQDRQRVQRAVTQLPDQYRTIVIRYYFQRQSYQEISRDLQVPMGTVATHLSRAKQLLKRMLTAEEGNQRGSPDTRAAAAVPRR